MCQKGARRVPPLAPSSSSSSSSSSGSPVRTATHSLKEIHCLWKSLFPARLPGTLPWHQTGTRRSHTRTSGAGPGSFLSLEPSGELRPWIAPLPLQRLIVALVGVSRSLQESATPGRLLAQGHKGSCKFSCSELNVPKSLHREIGYYGCRVGVKSDEQRVSGPEVVHCQAPSGAQGFKEGKN